MKKPELEIENFDQILKFLDEELYPFTANAEYWALLDKMRVLQRRPMEDHLVHQTLARHLHQKTKPLLSPHLYSYQKGIGPHHARQALLHFVSQYKKNVKDKKLRGLYILKADVKSYTDSVPLHQKSGLIQSLSKLFQNQPQLLDNYLNACRSTIQEQNSIVHPDSGEFQYVVGLPTGSHLTPVLANLYLIHLDQKISSIPGVFYSRYGDDLLIATPEQDQIFEIKQLLDQNLKRLELRVNPDKLKILYFNGAGKSDGILPGASMIDYLGHSVYWNGGQGINPKKLKAWNREFLTKLINTHRMIRKTQKKIPPLEMAKALCSVANHHYFAEHPYSTMVQTTPQRKAIHHFVARNIAYRVSQTYHNAAFHKFGWKKLIEECGLYLFKPKK